MIILRGNVLGEQQLSRALTRLVASTQNFSEPFRRIGEDFRDATKEQFDAEGRGWALLSPGYGAWKEMHYPGQTILRQTDRLYDAMTSRGAEDNVSEVGEMSARFGASGEAGRIGAFHQLGAGNLPVRKVIDLTEDDKRQFTRTFQQYFIRLGHETGFTVIL